MKSKRNYTTCSLCFLHFSQSVSSVTQSCPALCDSMDCSTAGFPVHHKLPKLTQNHVHQAGDAIQPSHPLSSPSPPAFNLSQHQSLFKCVTSSHQVATVKINSCSRTALKRRGIQPLLPPLMPFCSGTQPCGCPSKLNDSARVLTCGASHMRPPSSGCSLLN